MRLSRAIVLFSILLGLAGSALADTTSSESVRLLPATIGKFRQVSFANQTPEPYPPSTVAPVATQIAEYAGSNGSRVSITIMRFRQDAQAFERLSAAATEKDHSGLTREIGTAGYITAGRVVFFKGPNVVLIKTLKGDDQNLKDLARSLSETLDNGEGDIPVLVKHLPDPDKALKDVIYLNNIADLRGMPFLSPVFEVVQTNGNADAVISPWYGGNKVVIVEYHTPQLATENDQRIIARIHELWKLGQPAPTAYRRVGNYSVFVFDAPDEQTAKQLIDQVKYEQVVQWLGENPNILKEAEKRYVNTTLGVLVAVLKASGYAALLCLGIGGLIGGLLFTYRRAQQKDVTAFSDAGGMLRLNLDELSAETKASRLLQERN
ncbi:MAG TPA: DUF6599 family protein [Pyrinomonadaceae bacterium]|nr:DUF6599 family protein [Pyrinomonadaceae bacterium]